MTGMFHRRIPGGGAVANSRGMTLIEISVAVALLSVMGFLVYGSLVMTIRSQQRAEVLQERYHAARVFLMRFKREVAMAYLSLHQAEDQRTQTLFEGERDRIVFDTSAYEPIQRDAHESDQLEVEYRLDKDEEGVPSIIRRMKHHVDEDPGEGGREEVMIRGVDSFELEYYDKYSEDWESDWDVRIDDAITKREELQTLKMVRDELEGARGDAAESGDLGRMAGTELAAGALEKELASAEGEVLDKLYLPSRIRVRLVIVDEEGREYLLETQTEIRVTDPLWY